MWSAVILATMLATWRLIRLVRASVSLPAATKVVSNLLRMDNREGARKLCAAVPGSIFLRAVRGALETSGEPRAAFTETFDRALAPYQAGRWLDLAALAAGPTGVVIAATASPVSVPVILLGAAAALIALRNLRALGRLRRDGPAAFAAIAQALEASSRPLVPPPPPAAEDTAGEPLDEGGDILILIATVDGEEIGRIALDREVIKVGKIASSHFQLDHPSVSRVHAIIETTTEGSTIIDLGSTGGTRINGARINKAPITEGDEIGIGEVLVRVTTGPGVPLTRPRPRPEELEAAHSDLDLRSGTCPLCRGRTIAKRPAMAGDLVPWVCESCGYAQLFAPR
jgi:hypothetical protein